MDATVPIHAYKPLESKHLVRCEKDDPDATKGEVRPPGMTYSGDTVEADSLYRAEILAGRFKLASEAGEKNAFRKLRYFIGIK